LKALWRLPDDERASLLAMRRDLHAHPELSWQEERTAAKVADALRSLGLKARTGIAKTGVIADIGETGPMIALRADMDALPITEETGLPFASKHQGVMHACGHDAHTACLVAVARRLVASPPKEGRIRLLFQPAEEGAGGAEEMIKAGALEDPRPIAIYGLHVWSQYPTGIVSVSEGATMGSVDRFEITIQGKGGHAAAPHQTADPLVAAASLIMNLQTLVSRRLDPMSPVVVTVGQCSGGDAFNVIPDQARLLGTIRTLQRETWSAIPALLEQIVHASVAAFGCSAQIDLARLQMPLINHPAPSALVRKVASRFVEADHLIDRPMLAGEDFASYLEVIPGCFFFVGAAGDDATQAAPHHNPRFCLDETAFELATSLLEAVAREALAHAIQEESAGGSA
jgi:amidohydrolase